MDTDPASVMPDISGIPSDDDHAGDDIKLTVDPRLANLSMCWAMDWDMCRLELR